MKQQLYEGVGRGEGPVGGEEDTGVVGLLVLGIQQVGDQALQCGGLQPTHLHRVVLNEAEGCGGLGCVQARLDRLPVQGDPKHRPVLHLLPPFLHWVLTEEGRDRVR